MFHVPEQYRIRHGKLGTRKENGNRGLFIMPSSEKKLNLRAVASDGMSWEHVSVSTSERVPTWEEMCLVKNLFWDEEDVVIQFHPAKSKYVNCHPHCLHLWRPTNKEIPVPPAVLVGPREETV